MEWDTKKFLEEVETHNKKVNKWFFKTTPFSDWEFDNSLSIPELLTSMLHMIMDVYKSMTEFINNASTPTYDEIENDKFIHWKENE